MRMIVTVAVLVAGLVFTVPQKTWAESTADPHRELIDPAQCGRTDPLEGFNRAMYKFNEFFVFNMVDPFAAFWSKRLSNSAKEGLGNVYSNLIEIEFLLNSMLHSDLSGIGVSVARFTLNSTVGLGGWFDPASKLGLERTERDFGESLCVAGMPPGPYLVVPFVGPANLYSAPTLALGIAAEIYLLSFISRTLAILDLFVIDLGGSAAALRHSVDLPHNVEGDPYEIVRAEYEDYIIRGCNIPCQGPQIASKAAE